MYYSSLDDAAGAILLRITLISHNGTALIDTITATFHAKRIDTTKEISAGYLEPSFHTIDMIGLTEILW